MQAFGVWLQVFGAALTGAGLLIALYRVSNRFDQWRNNVRRSWLALYGRLLDKPRIDSATAPSPPFQTLTGHKPIVSTSDAEKLKFLAEALADDIKSLARPDNDLVKVRDIGWALAGLALSTIGLIAENLPLLFSSVCQCT